MMIDLLTWPPFFAVVFAMAVIYAFGYLSGRADGENRERQKKDRVSHN